MPNTAAQAEAQYFSETGYWVRFPFYQFFQDHGQVAIFGYPITAAIEDPATGITVQYFQRARMEYSPVSGVTLARLAKEMGYGWAPIPPEKIPADGPYVRYFPQSGHWTGYAFLAFFDLYGGVPIFGYPITEPYQDGGRTVQYFERVRMEWWPERPPAEHVTLTNLGMLYATQHVPELIGTGEGESSRPETASVTELLVVPSVKYPVTRQSGTQTVSVLVSDQMGNPVAGASVELTVYSSVSNDRYTALATSQQGIARQTFPVEPDHPGKPVIIDVKVVYGGLTATAQTSYMPWWGP